MPAIIATLPHLIAKHYKLAAFALLALFAVYKSHQAAKWHDRAIACQMASKAAAEATKALRAAERKEYQEKADHAEQEYRASLADARDATAKFIALRRLRPSGGVSPAKPIGEASDPGQPADVPASGVVVAESDVQACAAWQAYGVTAHDYILSIGE